MKLEVVSPDGTMLSKEVEQVSVPGEMGQFTMLHNHAPIVATLVKGKIVYRAQGVEGVLDIASGIVHAKENVVRIYIENVETTSSHA